MLQQQIVKRAAKLSNVAAFVVAVKDDDAALRAAESIVEQTGAHGTAILVTPLPSVVNSWDEGGAGVGWANIVASCHADAEQQRRDLRTRLARAAHPLAIDSIEFDAMLATREVGMFARHTDLAIFVRPKTDADYRQTLIEATLFDSGRPILVVPADWRGTANAKRVVVAWNASREAARAVGDAMSFLTDAELVSVVTIDAKPTASGHGGAPGADIAAHLARHGAKVEVRNLDGLGRPHEDIMLEEALSQNADLIVMGGYGHSRLSEFVLGGMTRHLLAHANVPLLLSH